MKIHRNVIESLLEENPKAKFLEFDTEKLTEESYQEAVLDLACIHGICYSDIDKSEKINQIKDITTT